MIRRRTKTILLRYLSALFCVNSFVVCGQSDLDSFKQASRLIRCKPHEWQVVLQENFTADTDLAGWPVPEGEWEIVDGQLCAVAGERNRAILLTHSGSDPVRIEFDAICYSDAEDGRIGDITVLLNASPDADFFRSGYALTTGSYWNNCTTFYRQGKAIAKTEYSPLQSGKKYHVRLEFDHGHIRYWLDDMIILELWDESPLTLDPELWIGVRTWSTRMCIDNFQVSVEAKAAPD